MRAADSDHGLFNSLFLDDLARNRCDVVLGLERRDRVVEILDSNRHVMNVVSQHQEEE